MNLNLIAATIIIALAACEPAALAGAFDLRSAGAAENFGINYPAQPAISGANLTPTSHHRLGNETGIGTSTFQTESSTVESTLPVQYTPTANPVVPDFFYSSPNEALGRFQTFSQRMVSVPSLTPQVLSTPNLKTETSPSMKPVEGAPALSPLVKPEIQIWKPHARQGFKIDLDLDNPLNGL